MIYPLKTISQVEPVSPSVRDIDKEKKVIDSVIFFLLKHLNDSLDTRDASICKNLETFKDSLDTMLTDSFEKLHCANLRTTTPHSNLYNLAKKHHIPQSALPKDLSIILSQRRSFYYKKGSNYLYQIFSL